MPTAIRKFLAKMLAQARRRGMTWEGYKGELRLQWLVHFTWPAEKKKKDEAERAAREPHRT